MVVDIVYELLAIAGALAYVGFLAYSIGAVELWVIVIATFALASVALVARLQRLRNGSPPRHAR